MRDQIRDRLARERAIEAYKERNLEKARKAHGRMKRMTVQEVQKKYEADLELKKDVSAEIAHAIFVGNKDRIYRAFTKQILKGDIKAFQVLASRAYGLPPQELAFSQDKPFKLVIEYVGEQPASTPETITIDPVESEEPSRLDKDLPREELFRLLNERRRLLAEKRLGPDSKITVEDMYARTHEPGEIPPRPFENRLEADSDVAEDGPAAEILD